MPRDRDGLSEGITRDLVRGRARTPARSRRPLSRLMALRPASVRRKGRPSGPLCSETPLRLTALTVAKGC